MKYSFLLFIGLLLGSCAKKEPRRPINKIKKQTVTDYSIKINKALNGLQELKIQKYINQDSLQVYKNSTYGFYYAKIKSSIENSKVKTGDTIQFVRSTFKLDGTIIAYLSTNNAETYIVDKMPLIKGLQQGVKLMREKEEFKFIFPSFVAHGIKGDGKSIQPNEPIIVNIKLLKINN